MKEAEIYPQEPDKARICFQMIIVIFLLQTMKG
jgi:hypothetical protein